MALSSSSRARGNGDGRLRAPAAQRGKARVVPDLLRTARPPAETVHPKPRQRYRPLIARALLSAARFLFRWLALVVLTTAAIVAAARTYAHHLAGPPTLADARRANLTIVAVLVLAA